MRDFINQFDRSVSRRIGRLPKGFAPLFRVASDSGHPAVTYIIAGSLLYVGLAGDNQILTFAAYIVALTHMTSSLLKRAFGRSRPTSYVPKSWTLKTHSFPSGHAAGSSVAYGTLAVVAFYLQLPIAPIIMPLVLAWIATIGVSRIYLGAHYASDVIAGWCLGSIGVLLICYFK